MCCELVDLLKILKNVCKFLNILTRFYECLQSPSSKSVVLKLFHIKDPQNYMYLAADPHLKKGMLFQKFALKNIYLRHPRCKLVDLLFFNRWIIKQNEKTDCLSLSLPIPPGPGQHLLQQEVPRALRGAGQGQVRPPGHTAEEQRGDCGHRGLHLPHPRHHRHRPRLPGPVLHRHAQVPGRQAQGAPQPVRRGRASQCAASRGDPQLGVLKGGSSGSPSSVDLDREFGFSLTPPPLIDSFTVRQGQRLRVLIQ